MSVCVQSVLRLHEEMSANGHQHVDVVIAVWSM